MVRTQLQYRLAPAQKPSKNRNGIPRSITATKLLNEDLGDFRIRNDELAPHLRNLTIGDHTRSLDRIWLKA